MPSPFSWNYPLRVKVVAIFGHGLNSRDLATYLSFSCVNPHNHLGFQHPLDGTNHASGLVFLTIDSIRHLVTLCKYICHLVLDSQLLRTFLHVSLYQYHTWEIPELTHTPPNPHQKPPIQDSAVFSSPQTMVQTPQGHFY